MDAFDGMSLSTHRAAMLIPALRRAKATHVNPATVLRWITVGVTIDGVKVRLAAKRVGKNYLTSEAAIAAFLAAMNPVIQTVPVDRTPAERNRESEAAAKKLEAGGW